MAMSIASKVIKITSNSETEILTTTNKTIIKSLSIVFRNTSEMRTVSLYLKESDSASDSGAILYNKLVSKDGIYIDNIFMGPGNVLSIVCDDYNSGDEIDVVVQYIELI